MPPAPGRAGGGRTGSADPVVWVRGSWRAWPQPVIVAPAKAGVQAIGFPLPDCAGTSFAGMTGTRVEPQTFESRSALHNPFLAGWSGDRFFMPRLPVNSGDDLALFRAKLEGAYDWLQALQYAHKVMQ